MQSGGVEDHEITFSIGEEDGYNEATIGLFGMEG